jgi:hypothetical protein
MARPHPLSRSILPSASASSSQAYDPTPSSPSAAPFARHHGRPLKRSRLNPTAAAPGAPAPALGSSEAARKPPIQAPPAVDFTAAQASGALQRVIASALAEAGFEGAQADVLWAVEDQVVNCQSRGRGSRRYTTSSTLTAVNVLPVDQG